jgi:UDP-2,3-diacylglucosamine pyrophosphatase LpxH
VLLGDVVELAEGRPQHALAVAEPVLRAIGERMGSARRVTVVPGNHDGPLVRAWVRAQGRSLETATEVPLDASPALRRLVSAFAPARVDVSYPGTWIGERTWATHGHYLDVHLLPVSGYGVFRGLLGRLPRDGAVPADYEQSRRPSTVRLTRWVPRPIAALLDDIAELVRAATMLRVRRHLLHPWLLPLTALVMRAQVRYAAIPALARVVHRLGVDADWVVFGHVHRLGPLPGDDRPAWSGPGGQPRILNTGSWVLEPLLLHQQSPMRRYWPGGAVLLEDDSEPRAIGLLDDVPVSQLR